MSRSLFVVLAVLALLASVSAQSSSTASSASSSYSRLSSSSSYAAAASSTGAQGSQGGSVATSSSVVKSASSSSSSSGYAIGTYSISFEVDFAYPITTANINATAVSVQADIVYNLAQETGFSNTTLASSVQVTSINGTRVAGSSRRLLQTTYPGGVTFVLLGSIVNSQPSFDTTTAVNAFVAAASNGQLVAKFTNATIPAQTIQASAVGGWTSSTGLGDNGASSVASTGAALLFAAVASLALLL